MIAVRKTEKGKAVRFKFDWGVLYAVPDEKSYAALMSDGHPRATFTKDEIDLIQDKQHLQTLHAIKSALNGCSVESTGDRLDYVSEGDWFPEVTTREALEASRAAAKDRIDRAMGRKVERADDKKHKGSLRQQRAISRYKKEQKID